MASRSIILITICGRWSSREDDIVLRRVAIHHMRAWYDKVTERNESNRLEPWREHVPSRLLYV